MDVQWYYRLFGEQFGPVRLEQLVELTKSETVTAADEVRQGDAGEWVRADSVASLLAAIPATRNDLGRSPDEFRDLSELNIESADQIEVAQDLSQLNFRFEESWEASSSSAATGDSGTDVTKQSPSTPPRTETLIEDRAASTADSGTPEKPSESSVVSDKVRSRDPSVAQSEIRSPNEQSATVAPETAPERDTRNEGTAKEPHQSGKLPGAPPAKRGATEKVTSGTVPPKPAQAASAPAPARSKSRKQIKNPAGRWRLPLTSNWLGGAFLRRAGAAVCLAAVVFLGWTFVVLPVMSSSDEYYYRRTSAIYEEFIQARSQNPGTGLDGFVARIKPEVSAIADELAATWDDSPARECLLFANRDCLLRMFAEERDGPGSKEAEFLRLMERAHTHLPGEEPVTN